MFITFTYRCEDSGCGKIEDRLVLRREMDAQRCNRCSGLLRRLPAAPRTTFRFADQKLKD